HSFPTRRSSDSPSLSSRPSSAEYLVGGIIRHKIPALLILAMIVAGGIATSVYLRSRSGAGTPIKAMAVMPFTNEGGNAGLEYLSDGMTETLINTLSQLPDLSVKARS